MRQFHFHGWPEVGIPTDGKGMINLIAAVQKQQQQSGNHPITVHCRWGSLSVLLPHTKHKEQRPIDASIHLHVPLSFLASVPVLGGQGPSVR